MSRSFGQVGQTADLGGEPIDEHRRLLRVLVEGVFQGTGKEREPGQRGLQFVGDVGGEIAPDTVDGEAGRLVADHEEGLARPAVSAFSRMQRYHLYGHEPLLRQLDDLGDGAAGLAGLVCERTRREGPSGHDEGRSLSVFERGLQDASRGWVGANQTAIGVEHYDAFTHGGQHLRGPLFLGGKLVHLGLQLRSHVVERPGQVAQFVVTADARPVAEVARSDPPGHLLEPLDRPGYRPGEEI